MNQPKTSVLVFDVNETLLDLSALGPDFESVFGDPHFLNDWFHQVIQFAMSLTLANAYRPFGEVALGVLQMLADAEGAELSLEEARRILSKVRTLPPHPDVPGALAFLKDAGFRLVTLTNNPMALVDAQMTNAELQRYFDRNFSVDTVRRFKPAPEPYRMVAEELGLAPGKMWMIAAHAWDVGGAAQVGFRTAFVRRPGKAPSPLFPKADVIGNTLLEAAEGIAGLERS
jgi:2-haloacid dehalogenase